MSNLDQYKKDLDKLIALGEQLQNSMQYECMKEEMVEQLEKQLDEESLKKFVKKLPKFTDEYQGWYSEAKALVRQLLPDRIDDFTRHYEKPKMRKDITFENYHIEDYLQGLVVTSSRGGYKSTVVDASAAIPKFRQQLAIVKSAKSRFESTLFDIKSIVQADIFDSELEVSKELLKNGFVRAAGAIAGVVLERHLKEVCGNHGLKSRKKSPTINDFNEMLKSEGTIDVPVWRNIQRLGDLRNLCGHPKERDPSGEEIEELIAGAEKYTHSLY